METVPVDRRDIASRSCQSLRGGEPSDARGQPA